jgi:radical SAM protein with 4Fe4S-binding SPASM domain
MTDYRRITQINDQLNDRYVAENAYENTVTYPKLITLTTTMRCNYRCWMCYQGNFSGDLDWRVVEQFKHVLPYVQNLQLFGGEPFLYDRFEELIALATSNGCQTDVITNGSLLDERRRAMVLEHGMSLVKVSLEAATQKTYAAIRGGDLHQVMGNIAALANERQARNLTQPTLQINFVAMRKNIEELPRLVHMAAEAGVDKLLVLFLNCQSRRDLAEESLFFHQQLSDECMAEAIRIGQEQGVEVTIPGLFTDGMEEELSVEIDRTCHSPWKNCIIDLDGRMTFCCGGVGYLGNILEQSFDTLWQSERITAFRRSVNTQHQLENCRTCRVKGRNFHDVSFHVRDSGLAKEMLAAHPNTPQSRKVSKEVSGKTNCCS